MINLTSEFSIIEACNEDFFAHNHPELASLSDHKAVYFFKVENKYMCFYCGKEPPSEITTQALLLVEEISTIHKSWKDIFQDLRK